ncbi:MAG: hypothetical protein FWC50_16310, partial [Planctomycetaceae bacterium]|nr:hypothetical protein [Planctomycetaceae bacterium]
MISPLLYMVKMMEKSTCEGMKFAINIQPCLGSFDLEVHNCFTVNHVAWQCDPNQTIRFLRREA